MFLKAALDLAMAKDPNQDRFDFVLEVPQGSCREAANAPRALGAEQPRLLSQAQSFLGFSIADGLLVRNAANRGVLGALAL